MFRPILIFGAATQGKTSFIGELVTELLPRLGEGKKARLYTAEHYNGVQEQVDNGLVEVWKVNTRNQPFETMHFACDGFWPQVTNGGVADGSSKFVPPGDDLNERYPIRIYEGLATMSNYITGNSVEGAMANRIGKGESIGPTDSGELIRIEDGEVVVGALSRSNIFFAQREMTSLVQRSMKNEGIIIWTSQETEVSEKKGKIATGRTLIGPQVIGAALTSTIAREFVDVWRVASVVLDDERQVLERRLYIKQHVDPLNSTLIGIGRNSAGLKVQGELPDFIRLTDPENPGAYRKDAAKIVVEKLRF